MDKNKLQLTIPYLDEREEAAVTEVIRSCWLTQGGRVAEFEDLVARRVGVKYAVACSSCTTALQIGLQILGIGAGDDVLVPSYTFIATPNAVLHVGARPVFVDIDLDTYNIDPGAVERTIQENYTKEGGCWVNRRNGRILKAIMPVHQVGLPADMDAILGVAQRYGLEVLEDAACAIGSSYKGKPVGGLSSLACFSFHPRKIITTGEGGMITTDDPELAAKARLLISHGASVSDIVRHHAGTVIFENYPEVGYNFRMTDMQGALGTAQMEKLEQILTKRRALAEYYNQRFADTPIIPPNTPDYATPNYQSYMVRLADNGKISRNEIMQRLLEQGIPCRRGLIACHLEPCYQKLDKMPSLPMTEKALESTIILPLYPQLERKQQDHVVDTILRLMTD
jgi:dTDP-4-amino-4,6-dideoxygalactose transaminase